MEIFFLLIFWFAIGFLTVNFVGSVLDFFRGGPIENLNVAAVGFVGIVILCALVIFFG